MYCVTWYLIGFIGMCYTLSKDQNVTVEDLGPLIPLSILGPVVLVLWACLEHSDKVIIKKREK